MLFSDWSRFAKISLEWGGRRKALQLNAKASVVNGIHETMVDMRIGLLRDTNNEKAFIPNTLPAAVHLEKAVPIPPTKMITGFKGSLETLDHRNLRTAERRAEVNARFKVIPIRP